jgi:membrane protein implicated in regulation of membrane protease activity
VRQEVRLAKVEMHQKLTRITTDLVALAAGGVVTALAGLALTAAVVLLLIDFAGLAPWLAALIVGAVLAIAGLTLLRRGITDLKRTDPTPRRTLEAIREDIEWVKEHRP